VDWDRPMESYQVKMKDVLQVEMRSGTHICNSGGVNGVDKLRSD
jgi:hypothetical protein